MISSLEIRLWMLKVPSGLQPTWARKLPSFEKFMMWMPFLWVVGRMCRVWKVS